MKRTLITPEINFFPEEFQSLLNGSNVYDSSCSHEARVYYIEKDSGYYLKSSPKGTLETEAKMADYFHKKGLSSAMLTYLSTDRDWMLTQRVAGEDCTFAQYREDPKRLSETVATLLRSLHETDHSGCPVPNRIATYLETADKNHKAGLFDTHIFTDEFTFPTATSAWEYLQKNKHYLKTDTLLHGDYCLPNIMLDNWSFSGFIDVGNGGVGDRHIDLFWGAWTLWFNLKTNDYRDRFFDAYGRDKLEPDLLKLISAAEVFG